MQPRTQATVRTRRRPSRRWWSTSIRYREPRVLMPQPRTSMPWPEEKGMEICKTPVRPTTECIDRQRSSYHSRCQVASLRNLLHRGMAAVQFIFRQVHFHRLQPSITYRASPTCMEISIRASAAIQDATVTSQDFLKDMVTHDSAPNYPANYLPQ
jgi:hypothetical protein